MLARNIGIFLCVCLPSVIRGEFYSSIDTLSELEAVEKALVLSTREHIVEMQEHLNMYTDFLERVKREHELAQQQYGDEEDPVLSFRLTKRLVEDWPLLLEQLQINQPRKDFKVIIDILSKEFGLPNRTDLVGAVKGLITLQNTYNLTASELSQGYLGNGHTETTMNWRDTYEIGVQLYELRWYKYAQEWFEAAINLINDKEDTSAMLSLLHLHEYLALTNLELGDQEKSLEYLNELVESDEETTAQTTLNYVSHRSPKCPFEYKLTDEYLHYGQLCQNKIPANTNTTRQKLNCYLDFKRHAIFRISPLKVEQAHLKPDINIYHDVLNDEQIDQIIKISEEFQKVRSTVGSSVVVDIRVSQQVWLNYSHPIMQTVRSSVGAITGFDMENAELMQVANYGIGGQYALHHDHIVKLSPYYLNKGNRLATAMFYLSDVPQGGHTVFSKLNVSLKPVKGAVVIWHNLLRSLENDLLTKHAGCPVIEGSKRIANIWIHSGMQEFRLPCTLNAAE